MGLLTVFTVLRSSQKLMALMNPKDEEEKQEEEISRMQTDVTDEEMALRYEHADGSSHSG